MYNDQGYASSNYAISTSEQEVQRRSLHKVRRRRNRFWRKAIAIAFSAALFGSAAGGAFYGVSALLEDSQAMPTLPTLQGDDIVISDMSYSPSSSTASQSLPPPLFIS